MPEYTNFVVMTRSEAKAFLDVFLAEMGPALVRFASAAGCELTYSRDSLEQVWSATVPKLAWRSGYLAPGVGQPGPRIALEQLDPPQELPAWFHHPSGAGYARFSAETLWLIDGAARYLGQTLLQNVEGRWAAGDSQAEGYVLENQPVIVGLGADPVSPLQTCAVLASRALRQEAEQGPQTLADVYDNWCAQKG